MTKTLDLPESVVVPTELAPAENPLGMLQALIDRGTDPVALGKMMDLAERWQANEAKRKYADALSGFQSECPMVFKKREVSRAADKGGARLYTFASYDDIKRLTRPLERKWGITTDFTFEATDDHKLRGTCRVRVGSHHEDKTLTVPIPKGVNTNVTQDGGMAVTYLKRYLYCAALDIVVTDEDNDADLDARITTDQVKEIERLLTETKSSRSRFFDWLRVVSLEDIKARDYGRVIDTLNRKKGGAR